MRDEGEKLIVKNRRAFFDYTIEEQYEGGLVLVGSEVKSMRQGRVDIVDAFASVDHDEMWLKQLYVAPFEQAKAFPHEPRRSRKVLLHKRENRRDPQGRRARRVHAHPAPALLQARPREGRAGAREGEEDPRQARRGIARKTDERETRAAIQRRGKGDA